MGSSPDPCKIDMSSNPEVFLLAREVKFPLSQIPYEQYDQKYCVVEDLIFSHFLLIRQHPKKPKEKPVGCNVFCSNF